MKLGLTELLVLLDAARGSSSLVDRRDFPMFNFTADTRMRVHDAVWKRLCELNLVVEVEAEKGAAE